MKNLFYFMTFLCLFSFFSCEKDIIGEGDITTVEQEPSLTTFTSVSGIVTDINQTPIQNATVRYNSETYLTDENGYFKINDIVASEDGGILKIQQNGYFDNFKYFIPSNEAQQHLRVVLPEKTPVGTISGTNGGRIELASGASLNFPNNAFADESNVSYEGDVTVYAHWYNPASTSFSAEMPGDLRAVNTEGQIQQLSTYGMMAVELFSSNGVELNLAEGKNATLEFPVPEDMQSQAPQTIKTWSLNEETVYWEEEATATLSNGKYVAEVSHFSFWNCDAPFPLVNIFGKLVDGDGNPLPWYNICILAFNNSQTGYGWTDADGGFSGKVPKNEELTLLIKDECGNVAVEQNIGPFSTDTSFGEIVVDSPNQITVRGTLQCSGIPVENGYAKITLDNGYFFIAEVDENGVFEQNLLSCEVGSITVIAYDLENLRTSEEFTFALNGQTLVDLQIIEACEDIDEYILYKINGEERIILNPSASILNGDLVITGAQDTFAENYITMVIPDAVVGSGLPVSEVTAFIWTSNSFFDFQCGNGGSDCDNTFAEITILGNQGEYTEGTFMGEGTSNQSGQTTIMGEWRINIDEILQGAAINGVVWNDDNEDGIRQPGEELLNSVRIQIYDPSGNVISSTSTKEDGSYDFPFIASDFSIAFFPPDLSEPTLVNQGADDTVDSDFDALTVSLTGGIEYNNYDLGLIIPEFFECEAEVTTPASCGGANGEATIYLGGQAPFSINLNGNNIPNITGQQYTIGNLAEGSYAVEIEDADGAQCATEFYMYTIDSLFCYVTSIPATCDVGGQATVIADGGTAPFSYVWNNGAIGATITDLDAGVYSVTATDAFGCTTVCETFVESFEELFVYAYYENQECDNGVVFTDLFVDVEIGSGDYTYQWSDGATTQFTNSDQVNISYDVFVIDNQTGCSGSATIFIEYSGTSIGDRVWVDDPNGDPDVFDANLDQGIGGVNLALFNANDLQNPIDTTTTNADGFYNFQFVQNGSYVIMVTAPTGYEFVNQNVGTDETIDSDVNLNGVTDVIVIDNCDPILDIDAGLKQ